MAAKGLFVSAQSAEDFRNAMIRVLEGHGLSATPAPRRNHPSRRNAHASLYAQRPGPWKRTPPRYAPALGRPRPVQAERLKIRLRRRACGACTTWDGVAQKTCVLPLAAVAGAVTTIEGLDPQGGLGAPSGLGRGKRFPVWLPPIGADQRPRRGPARSQPPTPRKRSSKPPWPVTFAAAAATRALRTQFRRRRPALAQDALFYRRHG